METIKARQFSISLLLLSPTIPSSIVVRETPREESKTWKSTDKEKKFVEESIIIGFFASPYGAGWAKDHH